LALPNYVHRRIALNRSSRSLEFAKPLLGIHSPLDRTMVLLEEVVQILDRSVAAPAADNLFLLYVCDAELYIGARSVWMTRGCGWDRSLSALRNSRLAASASRNTDNRKSMVAPAESIARYRQHRRPFIRMRVSSARHDLLVGLRCPAESLL
jgi:hypothetical protein